MTFTADEIRELKWLLGVHEKQLKKFREAEEKERDLRTRKANRHAQIVEQQPFKEPDVRQAEAWKQVEKEFAEEK